MNKSVLNLVNMFDVNIQNLDDAKKLINHLIQKYSREEIIKKTGVDKNVLYRLEHNQNITLENFLKIKRCYPEVFIPDNTTVGEIPIMGQMTGNQIIPCNPSQPKVFNAPQLSIENWSPCIAYINNQPNAFTGTVRVFSTKNINSNTINKQCFNRIVVLYPPDENPKFGVIRPNMKLTTWKLLDVYNGNVLTQGKVGADISWWRYTFTCSLHLMENETADKYNTEKTEDWYSKLNNTLINKLNK